MTFREKIADWIGGGKLSELYWSKQCWMDIADARLRELKVLDEALWKIVAQEKSTSNATVKRMARIAKEALGG